MEVRIAGVIIPKEKHIDRGLTAIFGMGHSTACKLLAKLKINPMTKAKDLTEDKIEALRSAIDFPVEGELRRTIGQNIKRKMDIHSYAGLRHRKGLPLKQRTRTNARTRKGRRRAATQ